MATWDVSWRKQQDLSAHSHGNDDMVRTGYPAMATRLDVERAPASCNYDFFTMT